MALDRPAPFSSSATRHCASPLSCAATRLSLCVQRRPDRDEPEAHQDGHRAQSLQLPAAQSQPDRLRYRSHRKRESLSLLLRTSVAGRRPRPAARGRCPRPLLPCGCFFWLQLRTDFQSAFLNGALRARLVRQPICLVQLFILLLTVSEPPAAAEA